MAALRTPAPRQPQHMGLPQGRPGLSDSELAATMANPQGTNVLMKNRDVLGDVGMGTPSGTQKQGETSWPHFSKLENYCGHSHPSKEMAFPR